MAGKPEVEKLRDRAYAITLTQEMSGRIASPEAGNRQRERIAGMDERRLRAFIARNGG